MQMYRAFRPLRGHRLDRIVSGIDDTSMDLRFETSLNTEYGTFGAIVIAAANFGDKLLALILKLEQWRERRHRRRALSATMATTAEVNAVERVSTGRSAASR
jgi:hypothetical protein